MPTTTISTIGSAGGRDYSTIQAWWDDRVKDVDLVGTDVVEIGELYADSTFTGNWVTSGTNTVSATQYAHLRSATGENPVIEGTGFFVWDLKTAYARVSGPLTVTKTGSGTGMPVILNGSVAGMRLDGFTIVNDSTETSSLQRGLTFVGGITDCVCSNLIILAGSSYGGAGAALYGSGTIASSNVLANCVVDSSSGGEYVRAFGGTSNLTIQNCYLLEGSVDLENGTNSGLTYCATDASSMSGSNHQTSITLADQFTDRAGGDYTLAATSDGIDNGTAQTDFSTDYNGDAHASNGTWDIGAFDYAVATGDTYWVVS